MALDLSHILVASDIDGTFVGADGDAVDANYDALQQLALAGGMFTFATGRASCHLGKEILRAAPYLRCPVICANGMCLYDMSHSRVLEEFFLDTACVIEAATLALRDNPSLGIRVATTDGIVVSSLTNPYLKAEPSGRYDGRRELPPEAWHPFRIHKFVFRGDSSALEPVRELLLTKFPKQFSPNKSLQTLLDVQGYGHSKATMLRELRSQLEAERGRRLFLVAVGDEENDMEMLRSADLAVCPANATDAVKEICDLCLCDHREGVIADLVRVLSEHDISTLKTRMKRRV